MENTRDCEEIAVGNHEKDMLEVRMVDLARTCHVCTGDPYTKSKLSIKRKCWGIFNKLDTNSRSANICKQPESQPFQALEIIQSV